MKNRVARVFSQSELENALNQPGLKLLYKAEKITTRAPMGQGRFGAAYSYGDVTGEAELDGNTIRGSAIYRLGSDIMVGGKGEFRSSTFRNLNAGIQYTAGGINAAAIAKNDFRDATLYCDTNTNGMTVAGIYETDSGRATVGASWQYNSQMTVFGRINQDAKVSIACQQLLQNDVYLVGTAKFDARKLDPNNIDFGFGITYGS